jgi:hypothetical protein
MLHAKLAPGALFTSAGSYQKSSEFGVSTEKITL